jgi:hypothetical protein
MEEKDTDSTEDNKGQQKKSETKATKTANRQAE